VGSGADHVHHLELQGASLSHHLVEQGVGHHLEPQGAGLGHHLEQQGIDPSLLPLGPPVTADGRPRPTSTGNPESLSIILSMLDGVN
jgi:hypothetical protein